jgi:hypothetical protein
VDRKAKQIKISTARYINKIPQISRQSNNAGSSVKEFLDFVLSKYIESGVEQLDQERLPTLLMLKYNAVTDATEYLGGVEMIRTTFLSFQKHLYAVRVA